MSKLSSGEKKIIAIKKIDDILEQNVDETATIDEMDLESQLKRDALKQELEQLIAQKERVLEDLRQAIEEEKANWQKEKEVERQEAEALGYKVGYDAGYEAVFDQYHEWIEEAKEIVALAKKDYDSTVAKHEQAIVQLALAIAEKIVSKQIELEPEYFHSMVKKAILDLKDSSNVEIYVHPSKYSFIQEQKDELEQMVRNEDVISIYPDPQLLENSCIIKHLYGQIDVSLDTQLEELKRALEDKVMER